jgi:hypothetical protein
MARLVDQTLRNPMTRFPRELEVSSHRRVSSGVRVTKYKPRRCVKRDANPWPDAIDCAAKGRLRSGDDAIGDASEDERARMDDGTPMKT